MNILLVEDDNELAEYVVIGLRDHEYIVDHVVSGRTGLSVAMERSHNVIILDRMLPDLDGLSIVRALRAARTFTPVLYLTALGGIDDRIEGLDAGGDDYLVKPFVLAELYARVRALSRRAVIDRSVVTHLCVGDLHMDLLQRTVTRAGHPIALLPQEFKLLEYLLRHVGHVVTRTMLLENVWDINFDPQTSVVESHVSRLRTKINRESSVDLIRTVRGAGYSIRAPE